MNKNTKQLRVGIKRSRVPGGGRKGGADYHCHMRKTLGAKSYRERLKNLGR